MVLATVGVFALSIVGFGRVQQQFFPLSERPELFFQLRLPAGTAFGTTLESVKKAEALLKGDKDISTYTAYVGRGSPRFWLGLNPQLPNESFAEIVIVSKDVEARERIKARLEKAVADGALSEARVRVDRFNFGPPVGFPVQFRVIGPDTKKVREIAYRVREVMRAQQSGDRSASRLERAVAVLEARCRSGSRARARHDAAGYFQVAEHADLGLRRSPRCATASRKSKWWRAPFLRSGSISRISATCRSIRKTASPSRCRRSPRLNMSHEEPILWRINRDMAITVRADVVDGVQPPDVTNAIWPKLQSIRDSLEPAYRIEIGGAIEESEKGNASIFALFPVMLVAMLTLLMIQLQSFSRLVLVFLTAPLGIIGASLGLECRRQALRLRRVARLDRLGRHDHAQRRDSGRPDRIGRRPRADPARGDRRGDRQAGAARHPHGHGGHSRDDSAVPLGLLGPDGDHHHGRSVRRYVLDPAVPAQPLRLVVS